MYLYPSKHTWACACVAFSIAEGLTLPQTDGTPASRIAAGIQTLQTWYDQNSGLWRTAGWWNSANSLTVLADYVILDPSRLPALKSVFDNTFRQAQSNGPSVSKTLSPSFLTDSTLSWPSASGNQSFSNNAGFRNDYYDDEGWWALAFVRIYESTKDTKYLAMAESLFDDMIHGYGTTPCGGLLWTKDPDKFYIGAIENELMLALAAQLALKTPRRVYYRNWALKIWKWFDHSKMINKDNNINNGLDLQCKNDNGTVWSYNQGVILGAFVDLDILLPGGQYLFLAYTIAAAAIKNLTDKNGILHEPCEPNCGNDGPQFKGIFVRNLQKLQKARPTSLFENFIKQNADSIWNNDRDRDGKFGLIWSGPVGNDLTATTHTSACDALLAAAALDSSHPA